MKIHELWSYCRNCWDRWYFRLQDDGQLHCEHCGAVYVSWRNE